MKIKLYIDPTAKDTLLFEIFDKNDERVLLSKIFLNDSTNSQNFTIKHLEETFHSSLLSLTNIPIEKANLVTSKFNNSSSMYFVKLLQNEISIGVALVYSFDEDDDFYLEEE
jgi:hypothetical protein